MEGGLMRAIGLQISGAVDSELIGPSTGSTDYTTCAWAAGWYQVKVISSEAVFAGITAPGLAGASHITSATTFPQGTVFSCSRITGVKLCSKTSGRSVIAHRRVLL